MPHQHKKTIGRHSHLRRNKKSHKKSGLARLLSLNLCLLVGIIAWIVYLNTGETQEEKGQSPKYASTPTKVKKASSRHPVKDNFRLPPKRKSLAELYSDQHENDLDMTANAAIETNVEKAKKNVLSAIVPVSHVTDKKKISVVEPESETVRSIHEMSFSEDIRPFLKTYCHECHGAKKQKAERRFDTLEFPIVDNNALVDYQDILDLLNLNEMPPEDEKQPAAKLKREIIAWLTDAIARKHASSQSTGGEVTLRRINRREYRHLMTDLFGFHEHTSFDPTTNFPEEVKEHHLDNQGHALITSGFLLDHYIRAADQVIEKVLPQDQQKLTQTKLHTWISKGPYDQRVTRAAIYAEMHEKGIPPKLYDKLKNYRPNSKKRNAKKDIMRQGKLNERQFEQLLKKVKSIPSEIRLYEHPRSFRVHNAYGYMPNLSEGVPTDGYYDISLTVTTKERQATLKGVSGSDPATPMIFNIVAGDRRRGNLSLPQIVEPVLFTKGLMGNNTAHHIKTRIWLDQGSTPRFLWRNGGHRIRETTLSWARNQMKKHKQNKGKLNAKYGEQAEFKFAFDAGMRIPHLRLSNIKLTGPIMVTSKKDDELTGRQLLLGGEDFIASKNRENLQRFMSKAFRRIAGRDEIERVMHYIRSQQQMGKTAYEAYKAALKAILCSPSFLYMVETDDAFASIAAQPQSAVKKRQIPAVSVANRLSFYLWASMPDETLMQAAQQNRLSPQVLDQQLERMLDHPKSDRLIEGLLDGWLSLDKLNSVLPDIRQNLKFYTNDLQSAMREETRRFLRHMIDENRPITDFIHADYTFVNFALADHYDIKENFKDHSFRKVKLSGTARGGLLGQGSILSITANGVETSPVVRGIWLLENLLGSPPPPPPPDVEPLDPDVRGAKSIRDRLKRHSSDPTCAECHRKIDPLGFALENFDPTGRWRTRYPRDEGGGHIESHGQMPGVRGKQSFRDFNDFKKILFRDQNRFSKALTEKLMAYALGRPIEITDRPEIDKILRDLRANGMGFRYLLKRIARSPQFQRA